MGRIQQFVSHLLGPYERHLYRRKQYYAKIKDVETAIDIVVFVLYVLVAVFVTNPMSWHAYYHYAAIISLIPMVCTQFMWLNRLDDNSTSASIWRHCLPCQIGLLVEMVLGTVIYLVISMAIMSSILLGSVGMMFVLYRIVTNRGQCTRPECPGCTKKLGVEWSDVIKDYPQAKFVGEEVEED
jgi:hypothetical protein